jgi:hypothetical protein
MNSMGGNIENEMHGITTGVDFAAMKRPLQGSTLLLSDSLLNPSCIASRALQILIEFG